MSAQSSSGLKEQFQFLQEQQRERYRSTKVQRSQSNGRIDVGADAETTLLNIAHRLPEDDLELMTNSQMRGVVESVSSVDSREVVLLHGQLEQLQLENAKLHTTVKEKEQELAEIQKCREEEREAFVGPSSKATQRIVELSQKNRELMADLTVQNTRVRQLQKKLKDVPIRTDPLPLAPPVPAKQMQNSSLEDKTIIAQLQEELAQAKQKITDYRNQCQLLRQDVKLAHKVLAKEVGVGVSVSAILSGVSGWRGRAQQIIALQNKVAELKQQLQQLQGDVGGQASVIMDEDKHTIEERQKATLRKIEQERRKNLDDIHSELESLRTAYGKSQQQCAALKARNKTLSAELKNLKSQLTTLTQKTSHDSELIEALMRSKSSDSTGSDDRVSMEREKLEQINQALQAQVEECFAEIRSLKKDSRQQPDHSISTQSTTPGSQGSFTRSTHSGTGVSLPSIPHPPSRRQTSRKGSTRKSISAGHVPQGPVNSHLTETRALLQVTEVERNRLLELTTVLQQRLDASRERLMRLETDLRTQRRWTAKLEKQHSKGLATSNKQGKLGPSMNTSAELENQYVLKFDENAVLKETLELTRHEKMEDIRLFHTMLQEAKQLFVESVRKLQVQGVDS